MLIPLGRFLRKIRIDRDENLAHMADRLGVTVSYVSAVENGKRNMPKEWRDKIVAMYALDELQAAEFDAHILGSAHKIIIDTAKANRRQKEVAAVFAQKLAGLSEDKLSEILRLLDAE